MDLANYRNEYAKYQLPEDNLLPDPNAQFHQWLDEAMSQNAPEPTAMTLCTVNAQGQPSARIVLLKGYDKNGLSFYTNYDSKKGKELEQNPKASLSFFWPTMQRQVRFEGIVTRMSRQESEQYFKSRPLSSKISAWASPQSKPISAIQLQERTKAMAEKLGQDPGCPPFWGGYLLQPNYVEFWQGRINRLHDRYAFTLINGHWQIKRLAP